MELQNTTRTRNERVLIVDGLNTFIRTWTVTPISNEEHYHVGGVIGFLKSVGFAIKQLNPTRLVIVFDGKNGSSARKKVDSNYKSNRDGAALRMHKSFLDKMVNEDPDESMKRQYNWLIELLSLLPVTTMIYDMVEADDVIGYLASDVLRETEQCVIMSTDKDFLQLINDKTIVWSPTKKQVYNKTTIRSEFGLSHNNLLMYRILDGDKSDNIQGVKGCGLKTIIKRFPEIVNDDKLDIEDIFKLSNKRLAESKIYKEILDSETRVRTNYELMQLSSVNISGITKMNILDRFNEELDEFNKLKFIKLIHTYGMADLMPNVQSWLNETYGRLLSN
jgi:DNA polymerase-1